MGRKTNINYLSEQVEKSLMEIFNSIFNTTSKLGYVQTVTDIALYLIGNGDKYDDILSRYEGVTKQNILQMIFSYFLIVNNYRKTNGIELDERRNNMLEILQNTKAEDIGVSLLQFDVYDIGWVLTDALIYINHPSPIYSANAIRSMIESGQFKQLYQVYPFELGSDQLADLTNPNLNEKEILLYTLIETIVIESERMIFSWGNFPIYDLGYTMLIENILNEYNGTNKLIPNINIRILENFNHKIGMTKGINYNKILILEIFLSAIRTKHRCCLPESQDEKDVLKALNQRNISTEMICKLYDENEEKIISSLISSWNKFPNETMLLDNKMFENLKIEEGKKRKRTI